MKEGAKSNGLLRIDDQSFDALVEVLKLPLEDKKKRIRDIEELKLKLKKRSMSLDSHNSQEDWNQQIPDKSRNSPERRKSETKSFI